MSVGSAPPSVADLRDALAVLRDAGLAGGRLADACESARSALKGGALHGRAIDRLSAAELTFAAGPRFDAASARAFVVLYRAYHAERREDASFARAALRAMDLFLDESGRA